MGVDPNASRIGRGPAWDTHLARVCQERRLIPKQLAGCGPRWVHCQLGADPKASGIGRGLAWDTHPAGACQERWLIPKQLGLV